MVRIGQGGQGRQELVAFRIGVGMRFHMSEIPDACQRVNRLLHGGSSAASHFLVAGSEALRVPAAPAAPLCSPIRRMPSSALLAGAFGPCTGAHVSVPGCASRRDEGKPKMATKIINGTITGGYTLKSAYTALRITTNGIIDGAAGGGAALTSQYGASIGNAGTLVAARGLWLHIRGRGRGSGAGASLAGGGTLQNAGAIYGGYGGSAKYNGGLGGCGVLLTGIGSLDNKGSIVSAAGAVPAT